MVDDNKKCPKSGVDEGDIEPKYGYIHGEWRECGGSNWHYENAEEKDKTFSQKTYASGAYDTIEKNDKKKEIHTSLRSGEVRSYVAGGKSSHVDGHHDVNVESTYRVEAAGDIGQASGKNYYRGTKNKEIKVKGDTAEVVAGSSARHVKAVTGITSTTYEDDDYRHSKGSSVQMIEKDKATIVKGDYAVNSQKGYDVKIEKKGRINTGDTFLLKTGATATINSASKIVTKSSSDTEMNSQAKFTATSQQDMTIKSEGGKVTVQGQDITITADSKITIKCGGSKIEISSSGIKIDASGDVDIKGSTTRIQGGGMPGLPTTFT